jgi:hypothetical protein
MQHYIFTDTIQHYKFTDTMQHYIFTDTIQHYILTDTIQHYIFTDTIQHYIFTDTIQHCIFTDTISTRRLLTANWRGEVQRCLAAGSSGNRSAWQPFRLNRVSVKQSSDNRGSAVFIIRLVNLFCEGMTTECRLQTVLCVASGWLSAHGVACWSVTFCRAQVYWSWLAVGRSSTRT